MDIEFELELYLRFRFSISLAPISYFISIRFISSIYIYYLFLFSGTNSALHLGFTSRLYIYNLYHYQGQELIFYYLDSIFRFTNKKRIGLRHTYERVYNNDVFGKSNTTWVY